MSSAKVLLLVGAVMLFGLSGSAAQTTVDKESPKENVTEAATVAEPELSTERFNASRVLSAIRAEIERRRSERREKTLQRAQELREQILQTLDNLSERRREFELRRQETLQDAEALREARRQDMEARRVGRLPQRERERVNQARLEKLTEQTTPEENEIEEDAIDGIAGGSGEATEGVQRVRNLLLIEEADGNLRLIDLDTEEGQQFVLNGGPKRGQSGEVAAEKEKEGEEAEQEREGEEEEEEQEASKRKLKTGQI
ncbi:neurofilament light polypeptide-like [Anopheles merus]|nr:neurofilament light polypeptide-like [Anopheles merus]